MKKLDLPAFTMHIPPYRCKSASKSRKVARNSDLNELIAAKVQAALTAALPEYLTMLGPILFQRSAEVDRLVDFRVGQVME